MEMFLNPILHKVHLLSINPNERRYSTLNPKYERINWMISFALVGKGKIQLLTPTGTLVGTPARQETLSESEKIFTEAWKAHVEQSDFESSPTYQTSTVFLQDVTLVETDTHFEDMYIFLDQVIGASFIGNYNLELSDEN